MSQIRGSSGTLANTNASGQLYVVPETNASSNPGNIGAFKLFSENDDGSVSGTAYLKSPETSPDYRLRVGVDTLKLSYTFNAAAQNTGIWKHAFTTMTMTQSAGFLNVNAAGTSTVSGNYAYLQTWKYFPILGTAPLTVEFTAALTSVALQANEVYQFGLGLAAAAADPVDGAWFELTSAGLYGVIRYNSGTATKQLLTATPRTLGTNVKYVMVLSEREVEFWIDDTLYGEIVIPAGQSQPFLNASLPVFIEKYNAGVVGASPSSILKVGDVTVTLMDIATNKPWFHQLAGMSQNGLYLQNGHIPASTALMSTQAIGTITTGSSPQTPNTAAAGSNTTTPVTGLGGWGSTNMVAAAATDFLMMAYQNPVPSNIVSGKNLYICGVYIDCINTGAAVATTPTTNLITLGLGATAATLATVETASFATGTTHAARRMQLGIVSAAVGTAIGGAYTPAIARNFTVPLIVRPGEFVELFFKTLVGTATASQTWTYNVVFDAYWE